MLEYRLLFFILGILIPGWSRSELSETQLHDAASSNQDLAQTTQPSVVAALEPPKLFHGSSTNEGTLNDLEDTQKPMFDSQSDSATQPELIMPGENSLDRLYKRSFTAQRNKAAKKIVDVRSVTIENSNDIENLKTEMNEMSTKMVRSLEIMTESLKNMTETLAKLPMKGFAQEDQEDEAISSSSDGIKKVDDYIKLHNALFKNRWEKLHVRPVREMKFLAVHLTIHLRQLLQVKEAEEYAKVYMWIQMEFYNEFLGWNPANFSGYNSIQASTLEDMWLPDIHLYNGLDIRNEKLRVQTIPTITTEKISENGTEYWAGKVDYSYPQISKFTCSFDTFYFPFDYQKCTLVFGSWAYQIHQILIFPEPADLRDFEENDEWRVDSLVHYNVTREYANQKHISQSHLEIIVKRRPLYYIVNLIIPSIIITQVSFFGMFTPSSSEGDRTEKVSLGMGTLLAMSVLLLIVSGMIPVSSTYVPLIGVFFLLIMCLISFGIMVTTLIMTIHQRGKRKKRVPHWAQRLFFFRVAPAIGFKIPSLIRKEAKTNILRGGPDVTNVKRDSAGGRAIEFSELPLLQELPQIRQLSEQINTAVRGRQRELAEVEYIFLAKVLDALMLLLFTFLLALLSVTIAICGVYQPTPKPTIPGREYFYGLSPTRILNGSLYEPGTNQTTVYNSTEKMEPILHATIYSSVCQCVCRVCPNLEQMIADKNDNRDMSTVERYDDINASQENGNISSAEEERNTPIDLSMNVTGKAETPDGII